jgi:hypothetical protein
VTCPTISVRCRKWIFSRTTYKSASPLGAARHSLESQGSMFSNLGPIAIALISWIVFNTIGKPLLSFFDLRTEVRRAMILYDNVRARWREADRLVVPSEDKDMTPDNYERLQEAENQYRDLASQVRALASSGLMGLSNTINTYGKTRAFHKQVINEAMKFAT